MGTKYSSVSISGYNSSPPADDGSVADSNKVKWQTHLDKIGAPIKTAFESANTALVTALDQSSTSTTTTATADATHHNQIIEIASTVSTAISIKLSDAATMAAGYIVNVHNLSAVQHTLARITGTDTINGTASNVPILPYTQLRAWVNTATNGYLVSNLDRGVTMGTVTSATGTAINFTGLPSKLKRINLMLIGVSGNTTVASALLVQIGDSGGIENSGYVAGAEAGGIDTTDPSGFAITRDAAFSETVTYNGLVILTLADSTNNTWVLNGNLHVTGSNLICVSGGYKSLSGTLDRITLTTLNGTDTFDAGSVNISYE